MQYPLHGQRRLVVQRACEPVVMDKYQFAGKEDTIGKFSSYFVHQLGQFIYPIGAVGFIGCGCYGMLVTEVYVILQRSMCLLLESVERTMSPVSRRVHRAHAEEYEVFEVSREKALHP